MTEILIPKPTEIEKLIYNPFVKHQTQKSVEIMRIKNYDKYTRIDFIYYPPSYYINGGWAQIYKESFIRPIGTDVRLTLIKADNIPLAPKKHFFKSSKDCLCYTLYFPALHRSVKKIDIIEKEATDSSYFNFYGVSLEAVKTTRLIVTN